MSGCDEFRGGAFAVGEFVEEELDCVIAIWRGVFEGAVGGLGDADHAGAGAFEKGVGAKECRGGLV